VLLGAAAASGALPFPRAAYEQAIHRAGIAVAGSLRGFAAGFDRASTAPASATDGTAATKDATGAPADAVGLPGDLDRRIEAALPAEARALARAGVRRLIDYQDKAYASFYLDRLEKIAALERALPASAHERVGHESPSAAVARYLALWMSYEDVIRVADLKTRAARFDRVRRETRAAASELVEVEEYMHPRVEEICDTLPAWLGRRVLATGWMRRVLERFTRHGRRVRSSSLPGFLLLHAIGGLRRLRRGTLRYSVEQARIESWLALIAQVLPRDPALASEIAECQRLVKGYGETHARGLARFEAIIAAAVSAPPGVATAQTVRDSRRAALDSI
ncbi:MAG: indolepyruvate oxidoreductase subunit beta family protein, partial [Gammaproteobacteria bacterium]|nr:indolepyruvate oxidoreductase subunit beta family protein [Gammaproteobacteria bacterium]